MAGAVNAPRQLRAAPRPVAEVAPAAPPAPVTKSLEYLGSRYTPAMHLVRREPGLGVYEEVSSQIHASDEERVQRALLAPVTDPESLQRIEAARTARSPKLAPVVEFRVRTPGASQ